MAARAQEGMGDCVIKPFEGTALYMTDFRNGSASQVREARTVKGTDSGLKSGQLVSIALSALVIRVARFISRRHAL